MQSEQSTAHADESTEIPPIPDQINECLQVMDFQFIRAIMVAIKWEWYPLGRPPTVHELKEHVKDLVAGCMTDFTADACDWASRSTGGFEAWTDGKIIRVAFVVTRYDGSERQ